ncbi:MAG: DUF5686 and carboxypeptidase regulatory-like domain-containing protein [Saprospiraceae bacterium]
MNTFLNRPYLSFFFLCIFLICGDTLFAQNISGYIQNSNNEPIPYVNIYVTQLGTGTTTDEEGYYFMNIDPGEFEFIYSALGYETKAIEIQIEDQPVTKNVWMESSDVELDQIVVRASKRDPAYAIIQNAIDAKPKYLKQVDSYRTKIYIKAIEETDRKEKKKRKAKKEKAKKEVVDTNPPEVDPFAEAEKAKLKAISGISMIESEILLNFQFPKKYKEERTAHKSYGSKAGLFIPRFGESDFNFYRNLVSVREVAEVPIISPLSRTAILSYKFKLIESKEENGLLVHKIKVTPRKKGNSTCKGYIYINEGLWNINRLDLSFAKGSLKFFDAFSVKQNYELLPDSTWLPYRMEFSYKTKEGRYTTFRGNTVMRYSDYETNYEFPPKFFGNEVSVTTREAYKRDTSYWKAARPEPLTLKQQKLVAYKDSVYAVHNSKPYKDSIQALYNKVTLMDLIWDGVGFRDHERKRSVFIGPIPDFLDFAIVGGFRAGPYTSFFKRWESGRWISTGGNVNVGFRNKDVQGSGRFRFRYNPKRLADVYTSGGRTFEAINSFDAYLNQLRNSNYFLNDYISAGHRIELLNGLFLRTNFKFNNRQSTSGYDTKNFVGEIIDDEAALEFDPYQAFISNISISFTPGQKFMSEPNRKIILGSKWPTFQIRHEKGWNQVFGSDISHDFVDFRIDHDLVLGYFGNSKYSFQTGTFLNTSKLKFVDTKFFRESDPWLYSDPLNSFQLLDTSITITKFFAEFHHIHHFNGSLINNIPLVRALRVHVVVGGGILWIQEDKLRHEEIFAGLERTFKLGARRRLRVGLYGVAANSNYTNADVGYKISLDLIDTWSRNWNF